MKGSSLLKWTEKVSSAALWAIAITFVACYITVGFLAITNWKKIEMSLQVLNLLVLGIGFAVLVWGFWGGVASAAGACIVTFLVSVVTGHLSQFNLERIPFFMECLLFIAVGYLCLQFLQREQVEETTDRRQLERLEEEYLALAIEYGKREDLLKVLQKKHERIQKLEEMAGKVRSAGSDGKKAIQVSLSEIVNVLGRGEAEVTLYRGSGIIRHSPEREPVEIADGRDEIDNWLNEHRTALLVNNLTHDVRFTPGFGKATRIMSLVAVPLMWGGELRGTLRLTSVVPQAFTHEDLRMVNDAASFLVACLSQAPS